MRVGDGFRVGFAARLPETKPHAGRQTYIVQLKLVTEAVQQGEI